MKLIIIIKGQTNIKMDRKKYWNEEYKNYWMQVTADANESTSDKTKIKKTTSGDYKSIGENVADKLFEEMSYQKEERLLDYGCGFGRFFDFFNNRASYYGIDISESMIDECRKLHPNHKEKFKVAEGERCSFKSGFFQKIICFGVFDACYQEQALKEMLRMIDIGGEILVTGKNNYYLDDDDQAYIAEVAARKKGHPNYFTDVEKMLQQISSCVKVELQRYFIRRGDFGKNLYVTEMPERFYEYAFIIKKEKNIDADFEKFSDNFSDTWKEKNNAIGMSDM